MSAPSGVITLTTDFGHQGPFVGVMKGAMLARFPQARIIDLTHEILVHWPAEAGFWLARAYQYFAPGTVHVAVVDPGVGTARSIIVVRAGGHLFVAPDNGLARAHRGPRARTRSSCTSAPPRSRGSGSTVSAPLFTGATSSRRSPRSSPPDACGPKSSERSPTRSCPPGSMSPRSKRAA